VASLEFEPAFTVEEIAAQVSVFLVPDPEFMNEDRVDLEDYFERIFQEELMAISEDEAQWPDCRDLRTFHQWFEVRGHSLVMDLGDDPIEVDEIE
jgi:hypothetical protein